MQRLNLDAADFVGARIDDILKDVKNSSTVTQVGSSPIFLTFHYLCEVAGLAETFPSFPVSEWPIPP